MDIIRVPQGRRQEFFNEFENSSAMTFEGVDISKAEYAKQLTDALVENGFKDNLLYKFKGGDMNEVYKLTDSNAYPDDLTFVVIPNFYNVGFKMSCGARWFDDIVCNNHIRQNAINKGGTPDFE